MNDLMDSFFTKGFDLASPSFWSGKRDFIPSLDMKETEKDYQVAVELPGMDEKDIHLALEENTLVIRGEKKQEKEEKEENYYVKEMSYGSFHRSIALPQEVEIDKVNASFNKGILTVFLPKSTKAKNNVKKIDIKSAP
jgi:HSP20 family protein